MKTYDAIDLRGEVPEWTRERAFEHMAYANTEKGASEGKLKQDPLTECNGASTTAQPWGKQASFCLYKRGPFSLYLLRGGKGKFAILLFD